jgi:addiction module HigA family antidote
MEQHNPPHPGELIYRTYIAPFEDITVASIARNLGVHKSTFNRIVAGQAGITADMAVKLSAVLGRSAESWLRLQTNYDLWQSRQAIDPADYVPIDFSKAS